MTFRTRHTVVKSIVKRALTAVGAALLLALPLVKPASALTPAASYSYTDPTYKTIQSSEGHQFAFAQTGCGFVDAHNTIRAAKPYDASKISVKDSDYCDTDASGNPITPRPADAYWRHDDANYLLVAGSSAAAAGQPAQSGLSGPAKLVVFDSSGNDPQLSDISIAPTTLSGANTSGTDLNFEMCRQDADTLSWLVCPMINMTNRFVAKLVGYVLDLLETKPLLAGDLHSNGLFIAWEQFRNIANILLVPIFLFSIYGLIASSGNQYSIARLLPRLVIATLLIQLSFYIAAAIIDIGNVMAAGIAGIFNFVNDSLRDSGAIAGQLPSHLASTPLDRGVGAAVGTGLAVALGWFVVAPALPPLFIIAVAFAAGIILTFVALALRQLAIVVMVVLAPLAFVLGVLPTTERWLREWFDNLIKLVLFYPLVVLFFAVASTLSLLADNAGNGVGQATSRFIAALLPVVVLLSTPLIFRFAGRLFATVAASIGGVSGRAKGGIIGDPRDPFSRAHQSKVGKLQLRRNRTMRLAGLAGLGWTARLTRPYDIQRQMYMAAGDRVKGYVSDVFPQRVRRLFLGEKPFKTRWNVEPWKQSDLDETNSFRYEAARLRRSEAEMANLAEVAAAYIGGHADRGIGFMFGVGKQYLDGSMARDVAETSYMTIRQNIKSAQRHLGMLSFDDISHPWVHRPDPDGLENADRLFQYAYGDYMLLPEDMRERNYKIKHSFLGVASGTLVEGQGEDVWYAAGNALRDDRILREYFALKRQPAASLTTDQRKFVKGVDGVLVKGEQVGASLKQRPRTDTVAAMAAAAGEGEEVFAGGYRTAGNELNAMMDFIGVAARVRQERKDRGL
jgi:hypothetical protein